MATMEPAAMEPAYMHSTTMEAATVEPTTVETAEPASVEPTSTTSSGERCRCHRQTQSYRASDDRILECHVALPFGMPAGVHMARRKGFTRPKMHVVACVYCMTTRE
jgi:hypothetical protein